MRTLRPVRVFEALPSNVDKYKGTSRPYWDDVASCVLMAYCDGLRWWRGSGHAYLGACAGLVAADLSTYPYLAKMRCIGPGGTSNPDGLSLPPTSTKIADTDFLVDYLVDGTTRALRPDGEQVIFSRGGEAPAPVLANFTLTGATGTIGELFKTPASFMNIPNLCVEVEAMFGRATTATGTPSVGILVGGVPIAIANMTAALASVVRVHGGFIVQTTNKQLCTYNLAPGSAGGIGTTGAPITLNLAATQIWSAAVVASGTSGNVHNLLSIRVKMGRG